MAGSGPFWDPVTQLVSVEGQLVCPVCKEEYRNNHILQCPTGHLFCEGCDKGRTCVTCRKPIARTIRNRQLEYISESTDILAIVGVLTEVSPPEEEGASQSQPVRRGPRCDYCQANDLLLWHQCLECPNKIICEYCIDMENWGRVPCCRHPSMRITSHAQAESADGIAEVRIPQ